MSEQDKKNLADLYNRCFRQLRGYLAKRTLCHETAADLAQDAFVRMLTSQNEQIKDPIRFLYRTAINLSIDELRARKRKEQSLSLDNPIEQLSAVDPEHDLYHKRRLELLSAAIDELPAKCQKVFILHRFENRSYSEIAESMGISRNMVEKHIIRALEHCREKLLQADVLN